MFRSLLPVMFAVLASFTVGCSPRSINPLVVTKDAIREPGIEGQWRFTNEKGESFSAVVVVLDQGYGITLSNESLKDGPPEQAKMFALLTRISTHMMVDFSAHPAELESSSAPYLLPVHQFGRFELSGGRLKLFMLSEDWLDKLLKADDAALAHIHAPSRVHPEGHDEVILTASTKELRTFFEKHVADSKAFDGPIEFVRIPPVDEAPKP